MKKETSFKIGAVTLIILSISMVAACICQFGCCKSNLETTRVTELPAISYESEINFQKKSALTVPQQLENVSDQGIVLPSDIIYVNESTEEWNEHNMYSMAEEEMLLLDSMAEEIPPEMMSFDYEIFLDDFVNMEHEQFMKEYEFKEVNK